MESFVSICGIDGKDPNKLQQLTTFGLYTEVPRDNGFSFQCTPVQCNSVSKTHTLFLIYDIYDLSVMLEERLTITLHSAVEFQLSGVVSLVPFFFFSFYFHEYLNKM